MLTTLMPSFAYTSALRPVWRHFMPLKSATLFSGFLNQPSACGLDGCAGHDDVELEVVLVEVAPHLQAAADVEPAQVIHVIHAEGPAGRRREERRGRILADPVVGDGMPAVEHLRAVIEHLEGRHDLPGGHRVDLDAALGQLVDALGEMLEVLLQRVARGPGRLHLDRLRGRAGACAKAPKESAAAAAAAVKRIFMECPLWCRAKLNRPRSQCQ